LTYGKIWVNLWSMIVTYWFCHSQHYYKMKIIVKLRLFWWNLDWFF